MLTYTIRRLLSAIPTLIVISFIIMLILDMAPGSPVDCPQTIPRDVCARLVEQLGANAPLPVKYWKWLVQMFWTEPLHYVQQWTGWCIGECEGRLRLISWRSKLPVLDLIWERMPQTLWVVGMGYLVGVMIAIPIGVISAYRQYSWFDQIGTFITMIGFSVPTFFVGLLLIIVFAVWLQWLPTKYDTTLVIDSWAAFGMQVRQMLMPVAVLALFNASQIAPFVRASMLDHLGSDYVRTARAKGLRERAVVLIHVLRNAMIPVVTVIALGIPGVFGGAIITEQIFGVNGLGQLLITGIQNTDIPLVQTLTFLFAVLIVLFNLIADVLYGMLDPRIRYD
jgi:peptide/nickel transport system permease protein